MKVSGEKIKKVRLDKELTVQQLADKMQVKRQAVEHWERNGVPTFKTLSKIAQALEIRPEFLLEQ